MVEFTFTCNKHERSPHCTSTHVLNSQMHAQNELSLQEARQEGTKGRWMDGWIDGLRTGEGRREGERTGTKGFRDIRKEGWKDGGKGEHNTDRGKRQC